jgi:signal transduction histidine kinase/DNA-binding response OmpR family regulator/CHASE3 domain sensor protein
MRFFPGNKTVLGFSLSIVLILFIGISSYLTINKYDDNSFWVNHTFQVIGSIDELDRQIVTVENAGRAYVLSGDERFLVTFSGSSQRVEYLLDHLHELTIDNLPQTLRIDSMRVVVADRLQDARKKDQIRQKGTTADVIQQTDMEHSRELTEKMNTLIAEMRNEERRLLVNRDEKMNRSRDFAFTADWIGTAISLFVVLVLMWYIAKTFNERREAEEKLKTTNISLEKVSAENKRRNWILSGSNELNAQLRGEMSLDVLARQVITELCSYVGAPVGAFYLMDDAQTGLTLLGTFAYAPEDVPHKKIALGEGLVGQAAFEKRVLTLTDIPDNYMPIRSGLGGMSPRHILAIPVGHEKGVKAVLELATTEAIGDERLEFLQFVVKDIGIAIESTQSRERVNALNGQLQEQAEALQLQQEELQASNEELIRQSEQLQASEEELKVQQEELQQTNAELEEKAQQLKLNNDELEVARLEIMNKATEVERNSRYKSEFLANMSHELRTPLNSILILAKLLSDNKGANLTDKQVEYASVMYKSGQDLLTLINDVLDLSKIEAGKTNVSIAPVTLSAIRADIAGMFREVASSKKINFTTNVDPGCPVEVYTDKDRIEQIIRNLLSNAFKFTHEGGRVRLHVEQVNPRTVSLRNEHLLSNAQVLAFHVSDNGIGIPRSKQDIIFEAFQQADGSTNRKYGGTGLGLSISRQLAAMLGGELRLESTEGEGSTFTLYLPVVHSAGTEPPIQAEGPKGVWQASGMDAIADRETAENHEALLKASRIMLVVEDDPIFAGILRDFAREKGYEVAWASRGDQAVAYARRYHPSAILLDVQLPVLDGWAVLRLLKADADTRNIPVHIVSGHDNRQKGLELGAINFLLKPLSKKDLDNVFTDISTGDDAAIKKVLIVEDDPIQQEHLDRVLREKERNIICVTAGTGTQAMKRIGEDAYDCIILDLTLPDMSGFALLEHLEGIRLPKATKIIVYTSKDIAREEETRLRRFTDTIVLKSGRSHERLLDEVTLFLHKIEEKTGSAAAAPYWPGQAVDDTLKGKKVLLVDDDIRNVFALSATLQSQGLDIVAASDGREGLEKLAQNPDTNIVLMDIMMPEMDGYEAMRRIREDPKMRKLPIIALTAKAMKDDREKCMEAGASDYITKPVDTDQLLSLMRVWLYNSL